MFEILSNINVDWMGKRKTFIGISIVVLLAGLFSAVGRQSMPGGTDAFNLGVDFKGGTVVTAKFRQRPSTDDIRSALQNSGISDSVIQESTDKTDEVLIQIGDFETGNKIKTADGQERNETGRDKVKKALETFGKEADGTTTLEQDASAAFKIIGTEAVGPVAGEQIRNTAIIATLLGLVGILLFIAFRYDWTYAAGAVIAVFHDVLVTLACFTIFQWEVNLNVVAALLTLVGFSVNDSIVIFDRIRENLTLNRNSSLYQLTNDSINQTMSRTIVTNGLVFLSVLALVLFGGEVLRSFSLALFVGSITGTFSTIAIASPIAIWWQSKLGMAKMKPTAQPNAGKDVIASASRRSVKRKRVE